MSPRRAPPTQNKTSGPSWLVIAGIAIVAVIAVLVAADLIAKAMSSAAPAPTGAAVSGRTKGQASAPVSLVEFSDFQ